MRQMYYQQNFKLGILGGGQLGRMLIQAGIDLNISFAVLDPDINAPCHQLTEFHHGKLTDYDTVIQFGQQCDLITIEIENVSTQALFELEKRGKNVFPQPRVIELIQNKQSQKRFFRDNNIPTADFILTANKTEVMDNLSYLPAVNKLAREGYDGRGVQILRNESDLNQAFDAPGLLEKLIDFEKEISIIAAKNETGQIITYPPVEMIFHPTKNLVEYLYAPAELADATIKKADAVARKVIDRLDMIGLLAVEMFVTKDGEILVNEVAPRPHNSGHQTIEANETSQYEQHLRAILNQPFGSTKIRSLSAMVNLLGEEGHTGEANYCGLEEVLAVEGVHVHLYGKKITKPFRKMGHVTIVDHDRESLKKKVNFVKTTLKVIT